MSALWKHWLTNIVMKLKYKKFVAAEIKTPILCHLLIFFSVHCSLDAGKNLSLCTVQENRHPGMSLNFFYSVRPLTRVSEDICILSKYD
jgi:hypothetical protein